MSDFCKQCSFEVFGEDYGDMASITTEEEWAAGKAALVLCENCGPCQVDPEGNCVSEDCSKYHGRKPPMFYSDSPALYVWMLIMLAAIIGGIAYVIS